MGYLKRLSVRAGAAPPAAARRFAPPPPRGRVA